MNHDISLVSTRGINFTVSYKENEDVLTYIPHDATKVQGRLLQRKPLHVYCNTWVFWEVMQTAVLTE
jgi:hypothetical protein